jgi:hypothetical protein
VIAYCCNGFFKRIAAFTELSNAGNQPGKRLALLGLDDSQAGKVVTNSEEVEVKFC